MQYTELLFLALAAGTITAAPVAQTWQAAVDQALAEANSAILSGAQLAQTGAQAGIDAANTAIANAGIGKRQASWQQEVATALTSANAAIQNGVDTANTAVGKRQSWQDSVAAALAQADAAVAKAQADGAAGVAAAQAAVDQARATAAAAVAKFGGS